MENPTQAPSTRTFMCAAVFIDIIEYSKKAVDRQLTMQEVQQHQAAYNCSLSVGMVKVG